ncbi:MULTISPECIES: hypothetical protein [unclassified Nostoc]|uniref:hypothetical protein n=1 Tax=unclassified Nostoc TaxID=2593658 RepID=UPI002AD502CE|nr:hypothetical protein [Nostoc sp. DedQUE03]MDZ7976179.1 hypothetical protein [Nostoc sp. DedQUE03]MDZ8047782.1 hypothetical protein [Nostoc sp. DedQUE02]
MKTEILDCDPEPVCQTAELELPEITRFVKEIEPLDSTSETNTHEDRSSAAPAGSNFCDEDFGDDDCAFERQEKSIQPSNQEVKEVLQQLRDIPCTPQFRLNAEIQRTVRNIKMGEVRL